MDNKLHKNKFVVGLTGGIACGKSSIASLFEKLGITVVDADLIARAVVEKGSPILLELQQAFGDNILNEDKTLNRKLMRQIVFDKEHPEKLDKLNSIIQPAIRKAMIEELQKAQGPYVIAMIPLLFEHHLEYLVDRVLVVDIKEDLQLERLVNRDHIDKNLALNIIAKQVDRPTRIKKADDLIKSDNSPLDKKVNLVLKLHNLYLKLASGNNKL